LWREFITFQQQLHMIHRCTMVYRLTRLWPLHMLHTVYQYSYCIKRANKGTRTHGTVPLNMSVLGCKFGNNGSNKRAALNFLKDYKGGYDGGSEKSDCGITAMAIHKKKIQEAENGYSKNLPEAVKLVIPTLMKWLSDLKQEENAIESIIRLLYFLKEEKELHTLKERIEKTLVNSMLEIGKELEFENT